jgi:hypothetical protein
MNLTPVLIVAIVFGTIGSIIIIPVWLRARERMRMQDTMRDAVQRGGALPPDVINAMTRLPTPLPGRMRDLRRGIILLCIAGAIATWGLLSQWNDGWMEPSSWYGVAALPGFIGLAYLAFGLLNRNRD